MVKVIVYSDGASRGNPGPSGAGAVLEDGSGNILQRLKKRLPPTTNNVAEYQGAIVGLQAARAAGATAVELRADSELLIRQLEGTYRVKASHLRPLHDEAMRLLRGFSKVKLTHVPREKNALADRLANEAIDDGGSAQEKGDKHGERRDRQTQLEIPWDEGEA
ncbi:MAG: ribonuclease HI family protein [Acidobacteriota bacterium]